MNKIVKVGPSDRSITKDIVFGHVMKNKENCLELLQSILPQLNLTSVEDVTAQQVIDEGLKEKSVRLDIMAKDNEGRLFDIEMQVARQEYIGKRLRYYQAEMDKFSLDRGLNYDQIADTYIIFLCPYDPFYRTRTRYEFSAREDHDPSIKLETGAHWIFLNSKGKDKDVNKGLQQFLDFMNGEIDISSTFIARLNKEIDRYVGSSEWRDDKMKLQTILRDTERERAIEDLKKSANRMRQLGANEANIFKMLKEDYHGQLSDEEIRKYMNETK